MSKLSERQTEKLADTIAIMKCSLAEKMVRKHSSPVYFKVTMAQGGFRAVEEFKQESVKLL